MSTGGPDLFVICKSCGSEVSPYITECPYCGSRLRKRAPKIDRDGRVTERRRRSPAPGLPRLRRDEIPGIRGDSLPLVTILLLVAGLVGTLLFRTSLGPEHLWISGKPGGDWWRVLTAPFVYNNTGYAFVVLGTVGLYGWLLGRRHGQVAVVVLFAIGGVAGTLAATAAYTVPVVLGAPGAALALLIAWALPDVLALRGGEDIDGDLLGTAVIAAVVALMPVAVTGASWIAEGVGVLGGVAVGLPLARAARRG